MGVFDSTSGRWQFDLCGDHLALNFANTVSSRHTDAPIERLTSYEELVSFAVQSDVIDENTGKRLLKQAKKRPVEAARVLNDALELRDALFGIFEKIALEQPPRDEDRRVLNERLQRMHLSRDLQWEWSCDPDALDVMLAPILQSAFDLITAKDVRQRIKLCGADDCVWLFLDTSKNGTRRWCDMKQCGNRMKARRFYERKREEAHSPKG